MDMELIMVKVEMEHVYHYAETVVCKSEVLSVPHMHLSCAYIYMHNISRWEHIHCADHQVKCA